MNDVAARLKRLAPQQAILALLQGGCEGGTPAQIQRELGEGYKYATIWQALQALKVKDLVERKRAGNDWYYYLPKEGQ